MKRILTITILSSALLFACTSGNKSAGEDSTINDTTAAVVTNPQNTAPGEACFLHIEGSAHQDSTKVHVIINGNKVTGDMQWLPAEKDSRKGTLAGTQEGNVIKAVWTFMQEGMQDTLAVEFDFPGDELKQKPLKANPTNGRQQTDAAANYTVTFKKVDCK